MLHSRGHRVHKGFDTVLEEALAQANEGPECLYISVDIDVLYLVFAPGICTPEPDGLTTADLLRAVRRVSLTGSLMDIGVVEVSSPYYGPAGLVLEVAHRVVLETISALAWFRFRPQL